MSATLKLYGITPTSAERLKLPISTKIADNLESLFKKEENRLAKEFKARYNKASAASVGPTLDSLQNPGASTYFFDILDSSGVLFEAYFELKLITDFYAWQIWYKRKGSDDEYSRLSSANHSGGSGAFQISLGNEEQINRLFVGTMAQDIEMDRVTKGYTDVILQTFGEPNAGAGGRPPEAFDAFNWAVKNRVLYEEGKLKYKLN